MNTTEWLKLYSKTTNWDYKEDEINEKKEIEKEQKMMEKILSQKEDKTC